MLLKIRLMITLNSHIYELKKQKDIIIRIITLSCSINFFLFLFNEKQWEKKKKKK